MTNEGSYRYLSLDKHPDNRQKDRQTERQTYRATKTTEPQLDNGCTNLLWYACKIFLYERAKFHCSKIPASIARSTLPPPSPGAIRWPTERFTTMFRRYFCFLKHIIFSTFSEHFGKIQKMKQFQKKIVFFAKQLKFSGNTSMLVRIFFGKYNTVMG